MSAREELHRLLDNIPESEDERAAVEADTHCRKTIGN
jgi:hypothetical protein